MQEDFEELRQLAAHLQDVLKHGYETIRPLAAQIISGGEQTIFCSGLFLNLLWVTLGNIVGGAVIVAGGLWLIESGKPAVGTCDNQPKAG